MDDVRFSVSVPRDEYDSLVRAAGLEERSLAAEVRVRLRRSLRERGEASASRGAPAADGAALSRSPSVALGEGAAVGRTPPVASSPSVVPLEGRDASQGRRAGTAAATPSAVRKGAGASRPSNGVCVHGLAAGVCLRPECKGLS